MNKQASRFGLGLGCNDRLLNCCSDVDINSLIDGETEIFTKPILDHLVNLL
jgi:hypothetical protein